MTLPKLPQKTFDGVTYQLTYQPPAPRKNREWEKPENLIRWKTTLDNRLAQPVIDKWLEENEADIQAAVEYYRYQNNDRPWWQWDEIRDPYDPIMQTLRAKPVPPESVLKLPLPKVDYSKQEVPTITGQQQEQAQPVAQPVIEPKNQAQSFMAALTQPGMLVQGLISGGMTTAITPGPLLLKLAAGGASFYGAVSGKTGESIQSAEEWLANQGLPSMSHLLLYLDYPAEAIERSLGLISIGYGTLFEATKKTGRLFGANSGAEAVGDFIRNLPTAWEASHFTYEAMKESFGGGAGLFDPASMATTEGDRVLLELYRRMQSGDLQFDSVDQMNEYAMEQFGTGGLLSDLAGHMLLDPLNAVGAVSKLGIQGVAKAKQALARTPEALKAAKMLELAASNADSGAEAIRTYGTMLRSSGLLTTDEISKMGGVTRWLAQVTRTGAPTRIERAMWGVKQGGTFVPTITPRVSALNRLGGALIQGIPMTVLGYGLGGPIGAGVLGGFGAVKGYWRFLTPTSRAVEALDNGSMAIARILNHAGGSVADPDQAAALAVKWVKAMGADNKGLAREISIATLDSPEASIVPHMLQDVGGKLDTALDAFKATKQQRTMLDNIARGLGMTTDDVLTEMKTADSAQALLRRYIDVAKTSTDTSAKSLFDQFNTKTLTGDGLQKAFLPFTRDNLPHNYETFMGQVYTMIGDHADKWAATYFGVKPDHLWGRIGRTIKNAQSAVLLGLNPSYLIQNTINNVVTAAVSGAFGLRTPTQIDNFWNTIMGVKPMRLSAGVGISGAGEDLLIGWSTRSLRGAAMDSGMVGKMGDAFSDLTKQMPMTRMSAAVERESSRQVYTAATIDAYRRMKRIGAGIDPMDRRLEGLLNGIEEKNGLPSGTLGEIIYQAIMSGDSREAIEKRLFGQVAKRQVDAFISQLADQVGLSEGTIHSTLEQTGTLQFLRDRLSDDYTPEEVVKTFNDLQRHMVDHFDDLYRKEVEGRAQYAADKVSTEGVQGLVDIVYDQAGSNLQRRLQGLANWEHFWERIGSADRRQKGVLVRDQFEIENANWQRWWTWNKSTWLGISKALGVESPVSRTLLKNTKDLSDSWLMAHTERNRLYREHFEQAFATPQERSAHWQQTKEAVRKVMDDAFTREIDINTRIGEQFTELLVRWAEQAKGAEYGAMVRQASEAWYTSLNSVLQKIGQDIGKFYDDVGKLKNQNEKNAAWVKFNEEHRIPQFKDIWTAQVDGVQGVYRAINEEPPAAVMPEEPPRPPRPPEQPQQPIEETPQPQPPTKEELLGEIRSLASTYGIASADASGRRMPGADIHIMNIVRKYGGDEAAQYANLSDVPYDLIAKAFRARAEAKAAKPVPVGRYGVDTSAIGQDAAQTYEFRYRIIDLDDLIASHGDDLQANPEYPQELQPRQRERQASETQVDSIASKLNPDAMLIDTHRIDSGPMIVGPDLVVESGNGRVLALRRAKNLYPDNYAKYRQKLIENASQYGIDPADIENIGAPVLVRERTSDVNRVDFTSEANQRATMSMSPAEIAAQDVANLPPNLIQSLEVGDEQTIDQALRHAHNSNVIRGFIGSLSETERAGLLDRNGEINAQGLERIKRALFATTYTGDAGHRLLLRLTESIDPGIQNLQNALFATLAQMARLESAAKTGKIPKSLSISDDIGKTVDVFARIKQNGITVTDYVQQLPMFDAELNANQMELLKFIDNNARSAKAMRKFIVEYTSGAMKQAPEGQVSMLGMPRITKGELLNAAAREAGKAEGITFTEERARQVRPTEVEAGRARLESAAAKQEQATPEPAKPVEVKPEKTVEEQAIEEIQQREELQVWAEEMQDDLDRFIKPAEQAEPPKPAGPQIAAQFGNVTFYRAPNGDLWRVTGEPGPVDSTTGMPGGARWEAPAHLADQAIEAFTGEKKTNVMPGGQAEMFGAEETMPLFTGTAMKVQDSLFKPVEQPRTEIMPGLEEAYKPGMKGSIEGGEAAGAGPLLPEKPAISQVVSDFEAFIEKYTAEGWRVDDIIFQRFAGDHNLTLRQDLIAAFTGTRPPKSKAGVTVLRAEYLKYIEAKKPKPDEPLFQGTPTPTRTIPLRDLPTVRQSRETLRQQWEATGKYRTDELDAGMAILDAFALSQQRWTGMTPREWYARAFGEVRLGDASDEISKALAQRGKRNIDTPEFARWFDGSQVVDEQGKPLVVYHGSQRVDRIAQKGAFLKKRATSGPMAYFTNDPEIASGYATGKQDTSLQVDSFENMFIFKLPGQRSEINLAQLWYYLDDATKERLRENLPLVNYKSSALERRRYELEAMYPEGSRTPEIQKEINDLYDATYMGDTTVVLSDFGMADESHWNYVLKNNRFNPIMATVEVWLSSGEFIGEEQRFMEVLRAAGLKLPFGSFRFEGNYAEARGVVPVYLNIKRPLDIANIPEETIAALEAASKKTRKKPSRWGADYWDKNLRDPAGWVEEVRNNPDSAFTSIPDWATATLKALGYDGIKDAGAKVPNKNNQTIWIPFEENQVKSVFNRGTWSSESNKILFQDAPVFYSYLDRVVQEIPQERMTVGQLRGILKAKGVKADELKWTGLDDLLDEKGDNAKITKAELARHMQEYQVEIKEVHYGKGALTDDDIFLKEGDTEWIEPEYETDEETGEIIGELSREAFREEVIISARRSSPNVPDVYYIVADDDAGSYYVEELQEAFDSRRDAWLAIKKDYISKANKGVSEVAGYPEYSNITIKGGENYRELLLTMPENKRVRSSIHRMIEKKNRLIEIATERAMADPEYLELRRKMNDARRRVEEGDYSAEAKQARESAEAEVQDRWRYLFEEVDEYSSLDEKIKIQQEFETERSPHWSHDNVLAHIRFDERVDADGKRVLFINEVQSDWHQSGRKYGYKHIPTEADLPEGWKLEYSKLDEESLKREIAELGWKIAQDSYGRYFVHDGAGNSDLGFNALSYMWDNPDLAMREALGYPFKGNELWTIRRPGGEIWGSDESREQILAQLYSVTNDSRAVAPAPFSKTWPELTMKRMIRWAAENDYDRVAFPTGPIAARIEGHQLIDNVETVRWEPGSRVIEYKPKGTGDSGFIRVAMDEGKTLQDYIGYDAAKQLEESPTYQSNMFENGIKILDTKNIVFGGEKMRWFYDRDLINVVDKYVKKWGARVGETKITVDMQERIPVSVYSFDVTQAMRDSVMQGQPLFQGPKGAVQFGNDMRAVIHAFQSADMSTFLHESAHVFRRWLPDEEMNVVTTWLRDDHKLEVEHFSGRFMGDDETVRMAEELYAQGFEQYIREGRAPTQGLQAHFEKLKQWLAAIYARLSGNPIVKISSEMRQHFDRILSGTDEVAYEQAGRWFETESGPARLMQNVDQTQQPAFRQWFGNSKVVDERGRPLVVYHGTKSENEFTSFNPGSHFGTSNQADAVLSYRRTRFEPGSYTHQNNPDERIIPVYLKIENPLRLRDLGGWDEQKIGFELDRLGYHDVGEKLRQTFEKSQALLDKIISSDTADVLRLYDEGIALRNANIKAALDELGYDGIVYKNAWEGEGDSYLVFEPTQIKSAIGNRGTFDPNDPNILYQHGGQVEPLKKGDDPEPTNMPLGTVDRLQGPPTTQMQEEAFNEYIWPILRQLEGMMRGREANIPKGIMGTIDPKSMAEVRKYLGKVYGQIADTKHMAIKLGEQKRDFALLNYSKRYEWDNVLGTIFPYEFWYTRSAMNWALRALERPAIFANYARTREAVRRMNSDKDMPTRLRNKIRLPMPYMQSERGAGVYVDPLRQLFPIDQLAMPFDRLWQQETLIDRRAQYILLDWQANEEITPAQAKDPQIIAKAKAMAEEQLDAEISNPLDLASTITGVSLPMQWGYNIARKRPENIGQLPITRFVQSLTALAGANQGRGYNLEGPLRRKLGMVEQSKYDQYFVERELARMVADGAIDVETAKQAMLDKQGEAYIQAQARVATVGAYRNLASVVALDTFPESEAEIRSLRAEYEKALEAREKGNKNAVQDFFDKYPEYEAQTYVGDDPEERLRQYLRGQVWEQYMGMDDLHKRQAREQMGDLFNDAFLNKETRSYDSISTETLTAWANQLGAETPKAAPGIPQLQGLELAPAAISETYQAMNDERDRLFPGIYRSQEAYFNLPEGRIRELFLGQHPELSKYWTWRDSYLAEHPQVIPYAIGDDNKLAGVDPGIQALVYQYRADRGKLFPDVFELQDAYFTLGSSAAKKGYLAAHPELKRYWDWQKDFMNAYPQTIPYIKSTESIAKAVLGDDWTGDIIPVDVASWPPALVRQVLGYYTANQPLTAGAKTALREEWKKTGSTETFNDWLDITLRQQLTGIGY